MRLTKKGNKEIAALNWTLLGMEMADPRWPPPK